MTQGGLEFNQQLAQQNALAKMQDQGATERAGLEAQLRAMLQQGQQSFQSQERQGSQAFQASRQDDMFNRRMNEIIKRNELTEPQGDKEPDEEI